MTLLPARAQAILPIAGALAVVGLCMWQVLFRGVPAVAQEGHQQAKADNPHWNKDRCAVCHVRDAAAPRAIPAEKVDALCLSCHDGKAAISEIHPIRSEERRGGKG